MAERGSLSVCCMTRGPAGRVAAMLSSLRPVVDEIVVALDDRAAPEVVAALADVADRLVGYRYEEPVDRPLPWLHRQATCDWLLTIDDDEIPSSDLVEALPALVRAGDVTHFFLPRRWLYPDEARYLDEPPWRPDYQLRLVLNDLRLLRFPDETHWPIAALGPSRYLDLPVYHADCLVNSREERERKARHYEALYPGKRVAGRPLNRAYYVPEHHPGARTVPVSDVDLSLIRAVLEASEPEPATKAPPLEVAPREDIDRFWAGESLSESAYRARLEAVEPLERIWAGEVRTLDVLVENRGDAVWPWGPDARPEIRLAYRWWSADGAHVLAEGLRTPMPADLLPGQASRVPMALSAPDEPGRRRLVIDLVHEHVRWFGCEVHLEVEVEPSHRLAVAGPLSEAELPRLADVVPDFEPVVLLGDGELPRPHALETAPSAEAYLLDGLPSGWRAAPVLAARTVRLVAAAGARRRGSRPSLPRGGDEFLEALAGTETLLVKTQSDGLRRERWARGATRAAARALGVRVEER